VPSPRSKASPNLLLTRLPSPLPFPRYGQPFPCILPPQKLKLSPRLLRRWARRWLSKKPAGMDMDSSDSQAAWNYPAGSRSEAVQHLLCNVCLLCGEQGPVQMHHIRRLSAIDRPGWRPKLRWEKIMAARKSKMIPVCERGHGHLRAGKYDRPKITENLLEKDRQRDSTSLAVYPTKEARRPCWRECRPGCWPWNCRLAGWP
jgi:hypothetical protein